MAILATTTSLPADYEIQRVLGAGTSGLVYLARDGGGHFCAVKEFAVSADVAQRFFREASMVFTLVHEHIVRCQNLLYGKGGRSYLVFEYVAGGTLRHYFEEHGVLSPDEAFDMLRQLCLGLQQAHDAGILHCDLKPENILLDSKDGNVTFKITDLGIARYTAEASESAGTSGSPAYMAPEQFYGRNDERSDIYSLGIIFYEALAGRRPFEGLPARLFTLHSQEPPDLSLITDPRCARILTLLLAKQPAARPANCGDIVAHIDAILNPEIESAEAVLSFDSIEPEPVELSPLKLRGNIFSVEVAGATRLLPVFGAASSRILVSDESSTDLVDLQSQRVRPKFLTEVALAVANYSRDGGIVFATNRSIRMFENGMSRLLFPHQTRIAAISQDLMRGRIVYASMKRVFCTSVAGTALWQADAPNYSRPPALLAKSTGEVVFSTGPIHPMLRVCSESGVVRHEIPVAGPVLALREETGSSRFSAVLQGLGADAPARLIVFSGTEIESETELETGIYHAAWHGSLLSLHYTDGRLQLLASDHSILWEYRSQGVALADAWHPQLRSWTVLERFEGSEWLRSFPLTPAQLQPTCA